MKSVNLPGGARMPKGRWFENLMIGFANEWLICIDPLMGPVAGAVAQSWLTWFFNNLFNKKISIDTAD